MLQSIEPLKKQKAYSAYLGVMKSFLKQLQMNATGLVNLANDFAIKGLRCSEVPEMDPKVIGKMGLKGIPGLRISKPSLGGLSG